MRKIILPAFLFLCVLSFTGCVAPWLDGGKSYTTGKGDFSLQPPAGWVFSEQRPGYIIATKDGLILQQLIVEIRELKDALPSSKRVLAATATPLELAEAVTDDMKADRALLGLEVKENTLAKLDGRDGFKTVISFHTTDKLRLTQAIYGCIESGKLYLLRLTSPTRHYYGRDQSAFEECVASFRFGKK